MNKSEIERANVQRIIAAMPEAERNLCNKMLLSLMASVGHPITGRTFMMAIAAANCEIACTTIRLGVVDENGEATNRYPVSQTAENATLSFIGATAADGAAPVLGKKLLSDAHIDRLTIKGPDDFHKQYTQQPMPASAKVRESLADVIPEATPAEILADRLITEWVNVHGKQIPWATCIEIIAIVTKMPDEERKRLLAMAEE